MPHPPLAVNAGPGQGAIYHAFTIGRVRFVVTDTRSERTATSLLVELQQQYPGRYSEGQLRTLQRRVQEWRRETLIRFNAEWIGEEWAGEDTAADDLDEISAGLDETPPERRPFAEEPEMLMTAG